VNTAERKYLNKVAQLPCLICKKLGYPGDAGVEIHHIRGIGLGLGVRNSHYNVLPLCVFHHRGNDGYHGMGRKAFERRYEVTESELLEQVKGLINEDESR
jgi:hypothetical protein